MVILFILALSLFVVGLASLVIDSSPVEDLITFMLSCVVLAWFFWSEIEKCLTSLLIS